MAEQYLVRVPGEVTSFANVMPVSDSVVFVSTVGTVDGALHVVKVSQSAAGFSSSTDKLDPATFQPAARGVLGKVGQVLFGSGLKHHKDSPSTLPSLRVRVVPWSNTCCMLVNVTQESVDCWQVPISPGAQPVFITSFQLPQLLEQGGGIGSVKLLDCVVMTDPGNHQLTCLALARGETVDGPQLAVHTLELPTGTGQAVNWVETFPVEEVPAAATRQLLCSDASGENVCIWREGASAYAVHLPSGDTQKVCHNALSCAWDGSMERGGTEGGSGSGAWLIIDASQGLLRMDVDSCTSDSARQDQPLDVDFDGVDDRQRDDAPPGVIPGPPTRETPSPALTSDQELAALDALEMAASDQILPSFLLRRLDSLGVLSSPGAANPVVLFSERLVDTLPKTWGGVGGAAVTEHLQDKIASHDALLHILHEGGIMTRLPASTIRLLLEHGQKLRSVFAVRQLENAVIDGRANAAAVATIQAIINYAGGRCMQQVSSVGLQERSEWEVFYSCPTATAVALFDSVSAMSAHVTGEPERAAAELEQLTDINAVLQSAVSGSQTVLRQYQQQYPQYINIALGKVLEPDWTMQEEARNALQRLTDAASRVLSNISSGAPQRRQEVVALLMEVTEHLLNGYAAASVAVGPTQKAVLLDQYSAVRQRTLQQLLDEAKQQCEEDAAGGPLLLQHLESVCEVHQAYEQLMEIAQLMGGHQRLHAHMAAVVRDGMPKFAYFVFDSLFRCGNYHSLLTLPDDFNEALYHWIHNKTQHNSDVSLLRVKELHEIRLCSFSEASRTLFQLAQHQQLGSMRSAQRALCLGKLAALADNEHTNELQHGTLMEADRKLAIMRVQDAMGLADGGVLDAADLVAACLEREDDPTAAVMALETMLVSGKSFREQHSSMFFAVWQRIIQSTDWSSLSQQRASMSDQEFLGQLASQPLAIAASRCFGEGAVELDENILDSVTPQQVLKVVVTLVAAPVAAAQCARTAFELGCGSGAQDDTAMDVQ